MTSDMQVRVVTVEFLRPGPPHNHLLSPLTQYLAICNNSGAGVVTVPYEHAEFERRLRLLRYEAGEPEERRPVLHEIGQQMGNILGAVPGLPGALTVDPHQLGTMIQLRITLSASELAMLPFELAKVPAAQTSAADAWLAIQARPPVCITRNVRTVSPEGVVWPDEPRILFVAGDPGSVPYEDHKRALLEAIRPFQYRGRDELREDGDRATAGELLTILVNPTLNDVLRECRAQRYTHLHILAHGDVEGHEFGLAMRGVDDSVDVVSGERLASAITSVTQGGIHRPSVVTFASCDSGNVGSVILPGADLAHALHQSGVPLVVAAQFPLSMEGSVPLASTLYEGLLWGAHPLVLLQQLRAELHARYTTTFHDWASLVVYEALPRSLDDQLDSLRYRQAKRAMEAALQQVDLAVSESEPKEPVLTEAVRAAEAAIGRLPLTGRYGVECLGLRGSAGKRLAQAAHKLAGVSAARRAPASWRGADPYDLLEKARRDYDEAERRFVMNEAHPMKRVATLHWVAVQAVALAVILGKRVDERLEGAWQVARLAAELYGSHPDVEERAWAHGSLAELWLLRLGTAGLADDLRKRCHENAIRHAEEIVRIYPDHDAFPVTSTARQIQRYLDWWGEPAFAEGLAARGSRRVPWDGDDGLRSTAEQLVGILGRWQPLPAAAAPTSPGSAGPGASLRTGRHMRGAPRKAGTKAGQFFTIEMVPAAHGDSLWIEYGDARATRRVLVDCGTEATAEFLLRKVDALPKKDRFLELFVMTHIDADHIGGALPFFKAVRAGLTFGDVWFNGWRQLSGTLGPRQGEMFTTAIEDFRLVWNGWRDGGPIAVGVGELPQHELPGGLRLTLLSPTSIQLRKLAPVWARELRRAGLEPGTRVDYRKFLKGSPSTSTDVDALADSPFRPDAAPANGSSIALLAEFGGASVLLAGDAHAPVLAESIRKLLASRGVPRLELDAFKLPHHASQNNVSRELLELVDCRRYLVSTNGEYFSHPDRPAIARVIKHSAEKPALYFNYRTRYNEVWDRPDLREKHGYTAHYPAEGKAGLTISLFES
jgi:beta-lactamase superfamily II metal-dependent hydrolase